MKKHNNQFRDPTKMVRFIDATSLLEVILGHFGVDLAYFGQDLQFCQEAIECAPTIDAVEVAHATWENVQNGKGCCSNCHRLDSIDNLATHCRYCGAKMDGDSDA